MSAIDVLVVGSGPSAVHAAWRPAQAGLRVVLVDVGEEPDQGLQPPPGDFATLRRSDEDQARYFLGPNLEGVPFGEVRVGAQLTPPRQYLTRRVAELAPTRSRAFQALQSLAVGGLGAGWGASTMPFTDEDLRPWPLDRASLQNHYAAVAERVGVCGAADDDLGRELGPALPLLPPAPSDSNGEALLARYARRREALRGRGLVAGAPRLALATVAHRGRGPLALNDMEFHGDGDRAVWRPRYSLEELLRLPNVEHRRGRLALRFEPTLVGARLHCHRVDTGEAEALEARSVVLAAGTLGTIRIVARSMGWHGRRFPLRSNAYTYVPGVLPGRVGRPSRDRRHSLTQVTMLFRAGEAMLQPQVYSYRSLLLFKLLKESPLAVRESLPLLQALAEALVVIGVFHPDEAATAESDCRLARGADPVHDRLVIDHRPDPAQVAARRAAERRFLALLPRLGVLPLRRIDPGPGASIHYGGCLPMDGADVDAACRLREAPAVRIADGTTFPTLPSKGLTFTLMANADRVGAAVARELSHGT